MLTIPNKTEITGQEAFCFKLKKGKLPCDGLKALFHGLSFLDCGTTTLLAYAETLRQVFKDKKFNMIFRPEGPNPFTLAWRRGTALHLFLQRAKIDNFEDIQGGQVVNIANSQNYGVKHMQGEAGSFNVMCKTERNKPKFVGLGLNSNGVDFNEVCTTLLKEYNKPPLGMDMFTDEIGKKILDTYTHADLRVSDGLKNDQLTEEKFFQQNSG